MNMLVDELRALSADPVAWGAVPVLAAFVVWSFASRRLCPLMNCANRISDEEARKVAGGPRVAGPRFLVLMLVGIVAAVTGLKLIGMGLYSTLAFYLLLAGVFVIQTEPARLQIREAQHRVAAARNRGEEAVASEIQRLGASHNWLIGLQAIMLVGTALFLVAFR
ncbi:hypothetical protein LNKW23_26940 [Paralimibaculum aggregatum]|uniref:DUF2269 family protein n=1 Tax=Paralimibaculum aggregatum TaxID=3036245 RepID=A0ABQ6LR46_9RHOB|nr:hypothetical protein [Limibaculum sp. NKW23]GMG83481.1 hypothetical protein LNKW23_26940 [Limibaculum sp. NKW23]